MRLHNIFFASLLISGASGASATAPSDSVGALARVARMEAPVQMRPVGVFLSNPAAMGFWNDCSYSRIEAVGSLDRADRARVVEQGRGHTLGNILASSYMRLSESTTVWGRAGFTTGQIRDVVWNNAADYELVSPYVFGDSVGGNLQTRRYAFSGGYAGRSGRWSWGAQASYRAAIDYRNRDPRDKIVVSDLKVAVGGTRAIGEYAVGLGADLRVYNQESSVEFFNPNNDIRAYAMLGLGNVYTRFSGSSNLDASYKGLGFGGSLQLFPRRGAGLMANVEFGYLRMKQVLRNYNNLDLTRADTYRLTAIVAYTRAVGKWSIAPELRFGASRRLGYENVFGSTVGNTYLKIGSRRNYWADRAGAAVALPAMVGLSDGLKLDFRPSVEYAYTHTDYRRPNRATETGAWRPALRAGVSWIFGRNMLRFAMEGAHTAASSLRCKLDGLDPDSAIGRTVLQNHAMASADVNSAGASLAYDREFPGGIVGGVELRGHHSYYNALGNINMAEAVVSVRF